MNLKEFSSKGGRASSAAKTEANRIKARAYWAEVKVGSRPGPKRPRVPPSPEKVGRLLSDYCEKVGIERLEIFGSSARGDARKGSDVDLMATFAANPGLNFYGMEDEMAAILGVPVHLLTRNSVERMSNPYKRQSILADAKVVFHV